MGCSTSKNIKTTGPEPEQATLSKVSTHGNSIDSATSCTVHDIESALVCRCPVVACQQERVML